MAQTELEKAVKRLTYVSAQLEKLGKEQKQLTIRIGELNAARLEEKWSKRDAEKTAK